MAHEPRAERLPGLGWLKHSGLPGNWDNAPRCGAKTRAGTPCRAAAMPNGRCRMHGGKSTGPRTPEGIQRIRASRTKHGRYSAAAIARRRKARSIIRAIRVLLHPNATADQVEQALDMLDDRP